MSANQIALTVLMLIAGLGIPVMASLNAGLGDRLANPIAAVAVLCFVALSLSLFLLAFTGIPSAPKLQTAPPFYYLAGGFFLLYIASITFAAPKIGLANAVFYVLLGQLVSAAIIDHFGLFGTTQTPITSRRAIGLIIMAAGVYLARKDIVPAVTQV